MILDQTIRRNLDELHRGLMRLHKVLLDEEKISYELQYGRVETPGQLLELVMRDPYFDWLHRISHLIIRIDEVTESKESTLTDAHDLLEAASALVRPRGEDDDFMKRYKSVLQRSSAAVTAHADVLKIAHANRH